MRKLLVLIGAIAVAVLMLGVASGGKATSAEAAECQTGSYWSNPTGSVGFNAGAGQMVTSVCIQTANGLNSGQIANGTTTDGCYAVSGVGTGAASVVRVNAAAACQAANIYAVYGSTLAGASSQTTPPSTQFAASGQANGLIVSGRIPAYDADGGMVVFGGGTIDQLVAATGCSSNMLALWTTVQGSFVVYLPGTSNTAVNAGFMAQYLNEQISGNTPFFGRCI